VCVRGQGGGLAPFSRWREARERQLEEEARQAAMGGAGPREDGDETEEEEEEEEIASLLPDAIERARPGDDGQVGGPCMRSRLTNTAVTRSRLTNAARASADAGDAPRRLATPFADAPVAPRCLSVWLRRLGEGCRLTCAACAGGWSGRWRQVGRDGRPAPRLSSARCVPGTC
jgi:hypothetical protein